MSGRTLDNHEVQKSLVEAVDEAYACSQTPHKGGVLGRPAMSMILSCVMAVGQALWEDGPKKEQQCGRNECFALEFYDEMIDQGSWMLMPAGVIDVRGETCKRLKDIRNKLAHALALPDDVILCRNQTIAREQESEQVEARG